MGIFIRTLYCYLLLVSCDGKSEFPNPKARIFLSTPSSHQLLNHSSVTEQPTPRQTLSFLPNAVKNLTTTMTEHNATLEILHSQQNQSSKVYSTDASSNGLPEEHRMEEPRTSPQTFFSIDEVLDSSKDQLLPSPKASPETTKDKLPEDPKQESSPSAAVEPASCEMPVNGMLDLSNRSLSQKLLKEIMDSRLCQTTMDEIQEVNLSHNNLQMDLVPLLLLLFKMKNVHAIDLSYNKLVVIPICSEQMQNLNESKLLFLNVSHNPLQTLRDLCLPQSLKRIDFSFIEINKIPQEIFILFPHVEEMYIQGNHFIYKASTFNFGKPKFPEIHDSALSYINFPRHSPIESLPKEVKHLVMSNCSIVELPEWFEMRMKKLLFLDLNNNPMETFPRLPTSLRHLDLSNCHIKVMTSLHLFSNLTVLKIQNNKIEDMSPQHLPSSLKQFDISKNQIHRFPFLGAHQKLETLNISGNFMKQLNFNTSYPSLRNLDASHNLISDLSDQMGKFLPELKFLNLSANKLSFLQPGSLPESLRELDISNNVITVIIKETFDPLINLKMLSVEGKYFFCNCDLYWFTNTYLASPRIQVRGQDELKCSFPLEKRGLLVQESNLTILHCSLALQMGIAICLAVLIMSIITTLCWRFDGPWYIKMSWYWCMAKRRQYKKAPENKLYDAFVSYSENDAPWTKEILLENLEANGFRICYHERDFMPGHPVLGNIFNCIENSHKVLFVLSPSFVNSCWCQYELYFAEHRVLNENQDSLIMVVLEDLPPNSIPQKFSKLRKLLKRKTYLKWSPEEHKQKLFWCQLNAVLKTNNEPMLQTDETEMHQTMDGVHLRRHEQGV